MERRWGAAWGDPTESGQEPPRAGPVAANRSSGAHGPGVGGAGSLPLLTLFSVITHSQPTVGSAFKTHLDDGSGLPTPSSRPLSPPHRLPAPTPLMNHPGPYYHELANHSTFMPPAQTAPLNARLLYLLGCPPRAPSHSDSTLRRLKTLPVTDRPPTSHPNPLPPPPRWPSHRLSAGLEPHPPRWGLLPSRGPHGSQRNPRRT